VSVLPLLLATAAAQTYVWTPWIRTENATALEVDWMIRYYDPKVVPVSNMTQSFGELQAAGYSTALTIGKDLREGQSYDGWLTNLSRAIDEMRSVTDMFILWDDPQAKGGAALRNNLAAALTARFPDVKFGVSIDVVYAPSSLSPTLPDLNYSYFSAILGYYYGSIRYDLFPNETPERKYVQGGQGYYDPGETTKVRLAIEAMQKIAGKTGAEVWFTDNAHMKAGKLTTTTLQMLLDYVEGSLTEADSLGWFMFDIYGQFKDTFYTGDPKGAPDQWARYYFLTTILIPLANSRLLESSDRINALEARLDRLETTISELPRLTRNGCENFLLMYLAGGLLLATLFHGPRRPRSGPGADAPNQHPRGTRPRGAKERPNAATNGVSGPVAPLRGQPGPG